ncbi:MAG: 7-cyano-7-deazaguanine synthase [Chloroflexi bacterium]|nr:7-cyano-7-deazaguanine synthase [Chloroflexota bacterium]
MDAWVLMSGGVDSTACAQFFIERGDTVRGIFVDYGQAARTPEYRAVTRISQYLGIQLFDLKLVSPNQFGSGEIIGRNAFLVFAALMTKSPGEGVISLGVHAGTSYYDCGDKFITDISRIVDSYSAGAVALFCPFLAEDKPTVHRYATKMGLPIELTYSCERGETPPCRHCLSCRDRNAL